MTATGDEVVYRRKNSLEHVIFASAASLDGAKNRSVKGISLSIRPSG
jgi:hypothetical protein